MELDQDLVYALCWRVLRHRQDAEDATQEALLKIARHGGSIGEPAKRRAWIHRVALNAATDFARRRRTRTGYETQAAPPPHEDPIAVHQAVADLPDLERGAVVEHYFHRRTLREIAKEEGVTEQAVWKRVEKAKERLRLSLALGVAAAIPFLDSTASAATRRLALVGVPLVLLATLGTVAVTRAVAEPPPPPAVAGSPASPTSKPAEPSSFPALPAPPPAGPAPPRRSWARPPYPLALPPASWTEARRATWKRLRQTRMTIDLQNVPLDFLLGELAALSGEVILRDAAVAAEHISFKVADIVLDGALRLSLQPRGLAFDILDDGMILVTPADRMPAGRLGELQAIGERRHALDRATVLLDAGWDGISAARPDLAGVNQSVGSPPCRRDPLNDLYLLMQGSKTGLALQLDDLPSEVLRRLQEPRECPRLQSTVREHLDAFCLEFGLGWFVPEDDDRVTLTTAAAAARGREVLEQRHAERLRLAAKLDAPWGDPPPASLAEFAARAERILGASVEISEGLWMSEEAPPGAGTPREALQELRARGVLRWALDDGRLILADPR